MKTITKTIANIIKPILPTIINEKQSYFVHKRLISDNVMIVDEVFKYINKNTRKNKGYAGIKLDM